MEETPLMICPIASLCGGCDYQGLPYQEELALKNRRLRELLADALDLPEDRMATIVPSPKVTHYRNRVDLSLRKTRQGEIFIGYRPSERRRSVLSVDHCAIAEEAINEALPRIKEEARQRLPDRYRMASLTVRTGDDRRVYWGGIGKRSNRLRPDQYLWTDAAGPRIFYSIDNFFQANVAIFPHLFAEIRTTGVLTKETVFYDLYGGVGLFSLGLAGTVKTAVLIEQNPASLTLAEYNRVYHKLDNMVIYSGSVGEMFGVALADHRGKNNVAMIDPPRAGLSDEACRWLAEVKDMAFLFYLSCCPESLVRDLRVLTQGGWEVERVVPFDFFPRTRHIETLVLMHRTL